MLTINNTRHSSLLEPIIENIPYPHMIIEVNVYNIRKHLCYNGEHKGLY